MIGDLEFELESYFQRRLSSSFRDQMEKYEQKGEKKVKSIKTGDFLINENNFKNEKKIRNPTDPLNPKNERKMLQDIANEFKDLESPGNLIYSVSMLHRLCIIYYLFRR